MFERWREELRTKALGYLLQGGTLLLDSLFLLLWMLLQYGVGKVCNSLSFDGLDEAALTVFRIVFATSTLMPVVINIYRDVRVMVLRAGKDIDRVKHEAERTPKP